MRKTAVLGGLATLATAGALLVGVGPAAADTIITFVSAPCSTSYGKITAQVSINSAGQELQYDVFSSANPIKSDSFVELTYTDGSSHDTKYVTNNGGAGGTWHYANANDHLQAREAQFYTYIGPDSDTHLCYYHVAW